MVIAYLFALLTGFVFAGFVSSLWSLLTGRALTFGLLGRTGALLLVDVVVITVCFPLLVLKLGINLIAGTRHMMLGLGAVCGAIVCSFFQGVVLLSVI